MYLNRTLLGFTAGLRSRIVGSAALGLLGVALGIGRLALLGWLLARVFAGATLVLQTQGKKGWFWYIPLHNDITSVGIVRGFEEMFEGAGPAITAAHCSRGCAFGDFDNDGDLDILIVNLNEPPSLLRNDLTGSQNWIKIKLEGVKSNRSAIGARVVVHYGGKKQAQALLSQSSFYSCNDPRLHFGLGPSTAADVEVFWPSGLHEKYKHVAANQLLTLREGAGPVPGKGWAR